MDQPRLASLSLTHVHYNPEDPVSFASAWLALVPQALCVVYVSLIWVSREVEVLLMFAGQLGCEAVNFALKRVIKEERPQQMYGKDYGMPSSHAQFVAYFAVYLCLFLFFRRTPAQPSSRAGAKSLERVAMSFVFCFGSALVAASRIYLNYHTPKQVLAGCAAGAVCAVSWFFATDFLRTAGWIDRALNLAIVRFARVRDLAISEDLDEAGWQRWEARRKSRRHGCSDPASSKSD
ncbi:hypothetical protein MPDQ_001691 [Monascus purpureus]|uniref:Dolichyldiphosphatase n=1 Tax=Monascus purpureus TaxID=5098 RepID=A0A507QR11_MONPU|nr:hypothetical protein MPDQ_001691 [Monascus purpureus]